MVKRVVQESVEVSTAPELTVEEDEELSVCALLQPLGLTIGKDSGFTL